MSPDIIRAIQDGHIKDGKMGEVMFILFSARNTQNEV